MNELVIDAKDLGKVYRIARESEHQDSLRDVIASSVRSLLKRDGASGSRDDFWALRNVGFQIRRGERVGIVGLNGAGKSTLLKILSRIVEPTEGSARMVGRVGALLEVGTGFHFELSGRENLYLYGAILGMTRKEINRKYADIVKFAGVEKFMDTPVKRYSSGMYVRLAFSVAAHLEPDILLIDEVLSVGDLPFQRKCMEFAKNLQGGKGTIMFVSHNLFSIKAMCDRVIYLRGGEVVFDGPTEQALDIYESDSQLGANDSTGGRNDLAPMVFTDVALTNVQGEPNRVFDYGDQMRIRLKYQTKRPVASPNVIVTLIRSDGVQCCNFCTNLDGVIPLEINGEGEIELTTPPLKLVAEMYTINVLVREHGFEGIICSQSAATFHIKHDILDLHFGVFHEDAEWTWNEAVNAEASLADS